MESSDFTHGRSVASGQQVIEKLEATGGTCDTYRVRINGKWHFLKRPKAEMSSNPLYITAFEREFDIGYRLEHKSLVRYIDKGIDQQGIYILTEMIDGCTLDEFVTKKPEYFKDKKHLKQFVSQMLDVLDYLHSNQVLHLDLKPSNIMITRMGQNVKLVDLGFAYSECYHDTAAGMTSVFAAPEQHFGGKLGAWTDIYALGRVLLWVCNNGNKNVGVRQVPKLYRSFVRKCVEEDYKLRFATINEAQHFLSSKQGRLTWFIGGLIATITLGIVMIWGIINPGNNDNSISLNNDSMVPYSGGDSIMITHQEQPTAATAIENPDDKIVKSQEQNKSSLNTQHNTLNDTVQPVSQPGHVIIIVPEILKSQVRSKAKAAFLTLDHNYAVLDDYQKRGVVMAEIKKSRHEILEYAKSQASTNEEKEKYYTVAVEILNDEYERSNLFKRLHSMQEK